MPDGSEREMDRIHARLDAHDKKINEALRDRDVRRVEVNQMIADVRDDIGGLKGMIEGVASDAKRGSDAVESAVSFWRFLRVTAAGLTTAGGAVWAFYTWSGDALIVIKKFFAGKP